MAECLVPPYLDQIGSRTAQAKAAFLIDPDIDAVSFSWQTRTWMNERASLLELNLGQQIADVICTFPVEMVAGFADAEPIRFELKWGDAEIWGE